MFIYLLKTRATFGYRGDVEAYLQLQSVRPL